MSHHTPTPDHRVFAVASGKGGVGKTTTAVNLGASIAASGHDVVVVDADLGMANLADFVGLSIAGPTFQDVLAGDAPLEKAIYRTTDGLAIVPGATDLDSYGTVETDRMGAVLDELREAFEFVFVDTGAGLHYDSALPIGLADEVVLVTTPWAAAARDAGKTRELAERLGTAAAGVVVTRVRNHPGEYTAEQIADVVGADVLVLVPEDDAVMECQASGRPLLATSPGSPAATAYQALADSVQVGESIHPVETGVRSTSPSTDANDVQEDEATSLAELLEREADHPDEDVLALTGGGGPSDDERDETDDRSDGVTVAGETADGILIAEETPPDERADEPEAMDVEDPLEGTVAEDADGSDDSGVMEPDLDALEADDPLADVPGADEESTGEADPIVTPEEGEDGVADQDGEDGPGGQAEDAGQDGVDDQDGGDGPDDVVGDVAPEPDTIDEPAESRHSPRSHESDEVGPSDESADPLAGLDLPEETDDADGWHPQTTAERVEEQSEERDADDESSERAVALVEQADEPTEDTGRSGILGRLAGLFK